MARFQEEIIGQIKEATDIITLVESYIPLRKRGKNFIGLCPFHEEKTPSFNVNPERKSFKCFGCGKGGDAISFVEAYERVDFPQALEILAERAGIAIKDRFAPEKTDELSGLRKALQFAEKYFSKNFQSKEGSQARNYVRARGITPETAAEFSLGLALPGWEGLKTEARRAGFSESILEKAGLLVRNEQGRFYDRFRNRLTIPIFDNLKRPLGFGARVFDDSKPKYLNSPESPLFSKGNLLYGLEKAKNTILDTGKVGIVEGYTDVILAHQAGVRNLVATLGTALTKDHAKLLRRYAHTIVLIFDGDEAGQKANDRGLEILLEEDFDIRVVILPEGLDPGDLVQQQGPEALQNALKNEIDFFEFALSRLSRRYDMSTISGKARAFDEVFVLLRKLRSSIKRDLLFPQIADRLNIAEKEVRKRFTDTTPVQGSKVNADIKTLLEKDLTRERGRNQQIEEELLAVLLKDASVLPFIRGKIAPEEFRTKGYQEIYEQMLCLYEESGTIPFAQLMDRLAGNPCRASIALWQEMEIEDPAKIAEQLLRAWVKERREEKIARLKNEARLAKKIGDKTAVDVPYAEIDRLLKEARTIHGS